MFTFYYPIGLLDHKLPLPKSIQPSAGHHYCESGLFRLKIFILLLSINYRLFMGSYLMSDKKIGIGAILMSDPLL